MESNCRPTPKSAKTKLRKAMLQRLALPAGGHFRTYIAIATVPYEEWYADRRDDAVQ